MLRILHSVFLVWLLAACAPPPAVADASPSHARFEPAPVPSVSPRRVGTLGALETPIPPKMPLGTGAVPVSSGPVRGSFVTGVRQSF